MSVRSPPDEAGHAHLQCLALEIGREAEHGDHHVRIARRRDRLFERRLGRWKPEQPDAFVLAVMVELETEAVAPPVAH